MRILVTGGTGFVGSHATAALVARGHDIRLLVRSPDRIAPAFEPHGIGELPYAVGDVTEPDAVSAAMANCDAVLHAASVYSLDIRQAQTVRRVNVAGTEAVLSAAGDNHLDPIVYISTVLALLPPEGNEVLGPQSPVKHPHGAYLETKADAERVARRFQDAGAPVVSAYPGAVFGPDDPHFGENAMMARDIVSGRARFAPPGGLSIVDVRDVAAAIAAMFEPGRGPRRYFLSGTNVPYGRIIDTFADVTGRKIRYLALPGWSLRPFVMSAGLAQRFLPFRLPVNTEGFDVVMWNPKGDDSSSQDELGFHARDVRDTFRDTIRWMYRSGHISSREAGRVAAE